MQRRKKVSFPPKCVHSDTIQNRGPPPPDTSELWYSNADIEKSRVDVRQANLAVNDTCGDLDDVDHGLICRSSVLREQQRQNALQLANDSSLQNADYHQLLATTSCALSLESRRMARLYATVLERDVSHDEPLQYDELLDVLHSVDQEDSISSLDAFDLATLHDKTHETDTTHTIAIPPKSECDPSCRNDVATDTASAKLPFVENTNSSSLSAYCESGSYVCNTPSDEKPSHSDAIPEMGKRQISQRTNPLAEGSIPEHKRQKRTTTLQHHHQDQAESQCDLAHALISLARWEFRSYKVTTEVHRVTHEK